MVKAEVIWTLTAAKQRREILQYWTSRNGSARYAEKIIKLTERRIRIIQSSPEAFTATAFPGVRTAAMGHFSIFYKFLNGGIIIVAFWDNRQDPKKLLEILHR